MRLTMSGSRGFCDGRTVGRGRAKARPAAGLVDVSSLPRRPLHPAAAAPHKFTTPQIDDVMPRVKPESTDTPPHVVARLRLTLALAARQGFVVRREPTGGGTTWCEIRGRRHLFVDATQTAPIQHAEVERILAESNRSATGRVLKSSGGSHPQSSHTG